MDNQVPEWACSQWGNYEHDWLECPQCLLAYDLYLESLREKDPREDEYGVVDNTRYDDKKQR